MENKFIMKTEKKEQGKVLKIIVIKTPFSYYP